MEFLRERVYTSLNADELKPGDKVIVSYNLYGLKEQVKMFTESAIDVIEVIQDEDYFNRFKIKHGESFLLAYLVERAENCTNCEGCGEGVDPRDERTKIMVCSQYKPKAEINLCDTCKDNFCECPAIGDNIKFGNGKGNDNVIECKCYKPKTEKKAEGYRWVNYRPFKDTDELIKVWEQKHRGVYPRPAGTMPLIWVREKGCNKSADLITCYGSKGITVRGEGMYFDTLFTMFEFLDGTPCGVEE